MDKLIYIHIYMNVYIYVCACVCIKMYQTSNSLKNARENTVKKLLLYSVGRIIDFWTSFESYQVMW